MIQVFSLTIFTLKVFLLIFSRSALLLLMFNRNYFREIILDLLEKLNNTRIRLQLLDTMLVMLQNIYTSEGVSLMENSRDISFCKRWVPLA